MSTISTTDPFTPRTTAQTDQAAADQSQGLGALTSDEFMSIIFEELTNQDPLSPSETKDLLEQIGLIRGIESDTQLSDRLEDIAQGTEDTNNQLIAEFQKLNSAMAAQSELATASGLVGKWVEAESETGEQVSGFVDSVIFKDGETSLILNSLNRQDEVSITAVTRVVDPSIISVNEQAPGAPDTPTEDAPSADFNNDGVVDQADHDTLAASFGSTGSFEDGDANGDGTIDFNDFNILLSQMSPPANPG